MIRNITNEDVRETREIKLEDLVGVKGASKAVAIIKEANEKDLRIACVGTQGSGKTLVLKAILFDKGSFDVAETCDNANNKETLEFANSTKCKYFTSSAKSAEELVDMIKTITGRETVRDCVVITRDVTDKGVKFIKSIDEITTFDGVTTINNIMTIHKDKCHKTNDITIG